MEKLAANQRDRDELFQRITTIQEQLRAECILTAERFAAQDRALRAAIETVREATIKADVATEKRFESVNEFRSTLSDQASKFITRQEFDQIKEHVSASITRAELWAWLMALAGLVVGVTVLIRHW